MENHFTGLVAAPFTPFDAGGEVDAKRIAEYAYFLKKRGVAAAFVCGTTGEGASLSVAEREAVAEAWLHAAQLPVIVHIGHTALPDALRLAAHAAAHGAAAVSALPPFFFRPQTTKGVADWCAALAGAAPELPFYYYHIPSMTGCEIRIPQLLEAVRGRVANFAGVKYTHEDLEDFATSLRCCDGQFDLLFGRDELLLEGVSRGARGAVGSTYNYASPLYLRLLATMDAGRMGEARMLQDKAIAMIEACNSIGVTHLAASKALMAWLGVDCGAVRLPLAAPTQEQLGQLHARLETIGFFDFVQ